MNYTANGNSITKIKYDRYGADLPECYILDDQEEISKFIDELNSLELIEVNSQTDTDRLHTSDEERNTISFDIYTDDKRTRDRLHYISISTKSIEVINDWDRCIAVYIIKDNYYLENPRNSFVSYYDDRYLDYEGIEFIKKLRGLSPS